MFVLDARFIDQSDNTAVSTWADRSSNGYDVSQATSANQPTLKVGAIGGSSIVRFDGSNDYLARSDTGFPTGDFTYVGVHKLGATIPSGQYRAIFHYGKAVTGQAIVVMYETNPVPGTDVFAFSQYGDGLSVTAGTSTRIGSVNRSGSNYEIRVDGGTAATKTMTTATQTYGTNGFTVGSWNASLSYGSYMNGDIGTVMIFASNLATSLRRRFERGCGLTWKIACS